MKTLQYLKRTASLEVTYGGAKEDNMKLSAWADAITYRAQIRAARYRGAR